VHTAGPVRNVWLRMNGRLPRWILYGCCGWVLEVAFTGVASLLDRDLAATSRTYLWMFPIYGMGGMVLEQVGGMLVRWGAGRAVRALAYVPLVYGMELTSGWLLCRLLGRCPWDYGSRGLNWHGLVRWDFAPFWYAFGWGFDLLRGALKRAPLSGIQKRDVGLKARRKERPSVQAGSFGSTPSSSPEGASAQ
jgi:hypothetical protein